MDTAGSLAAKLLATTPMFDRTSLAALEALAANSDRRILRRGEMLVREGDPSDRFFVVLSGRFTVHRNGVNDAVAEIGQGELVGEVGFFAGLPRIATVVAARDSIVLQIRDDQFERAAKTLPSLRQAVTTFLARRFAMQSPASAHAKEPARIRTLAIVPSGKNRISPAFIQHFRKALASNRQAVFLTGGDIANRFAGVAIDDQPVLDWLNHLESKAEMIIYVADDEPSDWTRVCIRQADSVLLLADASGSPDLSPCEELTLSIHSPSSIRLVLVHTRRTATVAGTASWLNLRPDIRQHHHVALDDAADVERLLRFVSGEARGFVAAGGGSLGCAHLGVYKAFVEAGGMFDYLGGTSSGAAMMAGFARGLDADEINRGTHQVFVKSRAFRRLTLPQYALLDHKVLDRTLQAEYGDVLIEDLWLPFFALSTNLSSRQAHVHRRGKLWQAVRASGSIPGVLPPFFTADGDMLVDGAIMNNLPLEQMKELKTGPNVVVSLGSDGPRKHNVDYDSIPGASELAVRLLTPFGRARLPKVPSMIQVITASILAHRPEEVAIGERDLLVSPPVSDTISFMDWSRHSELFLGAYEWTREWIEAHRGNGDPALQAILAASLGPHMPAVSGANPDHNTL